MSDFQEFDARHKMADPAYFGSNLEEQSQAKIFSCEFCVMQFPMYYMLAQHIDSIHSTTPRPFPCKANKPNKSAKGNTDPKPPAQKTPRKFGDGPKIAFSTPYSQTTGASKPSKVAIEAKLKQTRSETTVPELSSQLNKEGQEQRQNTTDKIPKVIRCRKCFETFSTSVQLTTHMQLHSIEPKPESRPKVIPILKPILECVLCCEEFNDAITFNAHCEGHMKTINKTGLPPSDSASAIKIPDSSTPEASDTNSEESSTPLQPNSDQPLQHAREEVAIAYVKLEGPTELKKKQATPMPHNALTDFLCLKEHADSTQRQATPETRGQATPQQPTLSAKADRRYICETCSLITSSPQSLGCVVCDACLANHDELDLHIAIKHSSLVVKCTVCLQLFDMERLFMKQPPQFKFYKSETWLLCLDQGELQDTNAEVFNCPSCVEILRSKRALKAHIDLVHTEQKPNKSREIRSGTQLVDDTDEEPQNCCKYCSKICKSKLDLALHVKLHTRPKSLRAVPECEICHLHFSSDTRLKAHMRSHTGDPRKMIRECEICSKTYASAFRMRRHQEKHRRFYCQLCPKSFKEDSSLSQHVLLAHSDAKVIKSYDPEVARLNAYGALSSADSKLRAATHASACKYHLNIRRGCDACLEAREVRTMIGKIQLRDDC